MTLNQGIFSQHFSPFRVHTQFFIWKFVIYFGTCNFNRGPLVDLHLEVSLSELWAIVSQALFALSIAIMTQHFKSSFSTNSQEQCKYPIFRVTQLSNGILSKHLLFLSTVESNSHIFTWHSKLSEKPIKMARYEVFALEYSYFPLIEEIIK